jgi:hypothetical protein
MTWPLDLSQVLLVGCQWSGSELAARWSPKCRGIHVAQRFTSESVRPWPYLRITSPANCACRRGQGVQTVVRPSERTWYSVVTGH